MADSDFISFTIAITNAGLSQPGFATPLIVGYGASFLGVRTYNQISDVAVDFAVGSVEYLAAAAIFGQPTHPTTVKIAAASNPPTMAYQLGTAAAVNSTKYQVQVDGPGITSTLVSVTSDASATIPEINNALLTALNAVVGANYTAAFSPLSFNNFTFTADSTTDHLTATAHGLNTGDGPVQVSNSGGALPAGLAAATNYWVIKIDANTFELATSLSNALAGTQIDITSNGTGTQTLLHQTGTVSPSLALTVTGNAAGNWFSLEIKDFALLSNKMTHADPGITATLTAINQADSDWYWLVMPWPSRTMLLATAAWTESHGKVYLPTSLETDSITQASGFGDTLDTLNGFGYTRTAAKWHSSPVQMFSAASIGAIAPKPPGTYTEAFKTLTGVQPMPLSPTHRTNLRARRAGSYTTERGRNVTWDGKVGSTVYAYLDITVVVDWFSSSVIGAALGVLFSLDKVAYTDEDIEAIATAIRGVIADAVSPAHKALDRGDPTDPSNPPPAVTFPLVASIAPATRALRQLPNGLITGRFQGAVQSIAFQAVLTF